MGIAFASMSERYEIRGKLGRGGMSTIYRGFDTVMGREVAIKRLLPIEKTNLNEDAGNVLEKEAAALAKFQHPNIVSVFAIEEDSEGPFVVMELIEGQDLHFVLTEGALAWDDFKDVATQCLEPLVEATKLNFLHRDLKPGNIMVTMTPSERFLVKILDFGLAKFSQQPSMQTLDQKGSFLGSIDYIAPEQLELRPLDQRTDLYSLGCVLYFSLAQKSPFTGSNPAETSMNHLKHRCPPIHELRGDVPKPVGDWLMKMISRKPADRPCDAAEALALFNAALDGVSPLAAPVEDQDAPEDAHEAHSPPSAPVAPPPPESEPVIPVAKAAEEPPSGLVMTPPSTVRVPRIETGPTTARQPVLPTPRTGSVAARKQTGAVAGRTVVTGAIPNRSHTSPTSAVKSASSEKGKRGKWLVLGVCAVLLLIGLSFLLSGNEVTNFNGGTPVVLTVPASETLSPLAFPSSPFSWGTQATPEPLSVSDGLVSRHLSTGLLFGRDYTKSPQVGAQVAAWGNPEQRSVESLLVRDSADQKGQYLPLLTQYTKTEIPNLKASTFAIAFNNQTSLRHRKSLFEAREAVTMVMVARIEPGVGRFLKVIPEATDQRFFFISSELTGKIAGICKPNPQGKESRVQLNPPLYNTGVFLYSIDIKEGQHRLVIGESATGEIRSAGGKFQVPRQLPQATLSRLTLGKRGFSENFVEEFGTGVFEVLVYDRMLSEEEEKKLTNQLLKRYFVAGGK